MRAEVVWLEQYLQEREQEYVAGLEGQVVAGEDEEEEKQRQLQGQRLRLRGRKYGMSECLCHNDLLSGNILLRNQQLVEAEALLLLPSPASSESAEQQEEEKKPKEGECTTGTVAVHIIDYEYAAYNYRAFDIANHFSGMLNGIICNGTITLSIFVLILFLLLLLLCFRVLWVRL